MLKIEPKRKSMWDFITGNAVSVPRERESSMKRVSGCINNKETRSRVGLNVVFQAPLTKRKHNVL